MKIQVNRQGEAGLTLFEVGLVVAIMFIIGVLVLGLIGTGAQKKSQKINCSNNLKMVGLAYRIWEGDNNDRYPMGVSVTNGGAMELVVAGNVVHAFQVMSNELSTTKVLYCPNDKTRFYAATFSGLANSNISYFVNAGVIGEANPQAVTFGDCNFEMGGVPVKIGLLRLATNDPVAWSAARHVHSGNLGMADGSVQASTTSGMRSYFINAGMATNWLAIP